MLTSESGRCVVPANVAADSAIVGARESLISLMRASGTVVAVVVVDDRAAHHRVGSRHRDHAAERFAQGVLGAVASEGL